MRISHNITALNTYRQYNTNSVNTNKSMEKLSSGSRINRAADDAAGLSISEKMRSQIRGLTQATRNAQDGISFIQTAEGALNEVSDMLTRMKELVTQVKNGTYSADDQANIGAELKALGEAITNIYTETRFNGIGVFGAQNAGDVPGKTAEQVAEALTDVISVYEYFKYEGDKWLKAENFPEEEEDWVWEELTTNAPSFSASQVGLAEGTIYIRNDDGTISTITADGDADEVVNLSEIPATSTGVLSSQTGAGTAAVIKYGEDGGQSVVIKQAKTEELSKLITKTAKGTAVSVLSIEDAEVESAITEVNTTRAAYGAQQNQLEHAANNMATTKENLQAAESRIRDVDMAEEMMSYTKNNILLQAAQAMLAQANAQPQGILQLLQ